MAQKADTIPFCDGSCADTEFSFPDIQFFILCKMVLYADTYAVTCNDNLS